MDTDKFYEKYSHHEPVSYNNSSVRVRPVHQNLHERCCGRLPMLRHLTVREPAMCRSGAVCGRILPSTMARDIGLVRWNGWQSVESCI